MHKIQRNSENNFQSGDFCYLRSYCVGTHTCVRTCILSHMATMRLYTCVYACYKAVYRPTRVFTHVYNSLPLYTPVATCVYMPVSVYIHVYSRIEEDCSGADGWAKNQLGERRLGELFFGRQTIGRQRHMQFVFLLASINSTSSAVTHWMQSFNASVQHDILRRIRCLVVGS